MLNKKNKKNSLQIDISGVTREAYLTSIEYIRYIHETTTQNGVKNGEYLSNILGMSLEYLWNIWGVASGYLGDISVISWGYCGISYGYLGESGSLK